MATIKSYTDLQQSKKLAEILSIESADMVYFGIHQGMDGEYYLSGTNTEDDVVPIYKNFCIKVFAKTTASDVINQLPCWSLAALLDVLPSATLDSSDDHHYRLHCMERFTEWHNNAIDTCYEMILKLNELNSL